MTAAIAPAKINLALVVGPLRPDGKHEVLTVMQAIGLADRVNVTPADGLAVTGFADDTIVGAALTALAAAAEVEPCWHVEIEKEIPVAAGLGGGSADAATALRLANALLPRPLEPARLLEVAAGVGADVPFFLAGGTQLGTGDGSEVEPLRLPLAYHVLVALPHGVEKASTASVYAAFDERGGARGFASRAAALRESLGAVRALHDLSALPPNDLAPSPLAERVLALGAFRADVSGAGPSVYGLFADEEGAVAAAEALAADARTWVTVPLERADALWQGVPRLP